MMFRVGAWHLIWFSWVIGLSGFASVTAAGCAAGEAPGADAEPASDVDAGPALTTGLAGSTFACGSVSACTGSSRFNEALCGIVVDASGQSWTVPAQIHAAGPTCVDLYNDCTGGGDNPDYASQLSTVVVDERGTEITATLFGTISSSST